MIILVIRTEVELIILVERCELKFNDAKRRIEGTTPTLHEIKLEEKLSKVGFNQKEKQQKCQLQINLNTSTKGYGSKWAKNIGGGRKVQVK